MNRHEPPRENDLQSSSILAALAGVLLAVVWGTEIAGDPTDGFAFLTLAIGAALLLGIALVVAASRRRDVFGNLGLVGAIVVLVASLGLDVLGFAAAFVGLTLIGVSARGEPRLLLGLAMLAVGVLALGVGIESSDEAYAVFLPLIVVGTGVLARGLHGVAPRSKRS